MIRGLHIDLKGVQYRHEYLPQLLADLSEQGVNTLLVEYEDVFPFEGHSFALDKECQWSREHLRDFLNLARENNLEVIPLQQCLGHLEYIFRWHEYRHFALDQKYPSTLDIFNKQARAVLFGLLRQILETHADSRFIHLGMDEAHALSALAAKQNADVMEIFLGYLDDLCALCEEYDKTPIIWSDMLADHLSLESLSLLRQFQNRVILCPWDYSGSGEITTTIRLGGLRVSREWLAHSTDPQAPTISAGTKFFEDLPPETQQLAGKFQQGRFFATQAEARLWYGLGFKVLGATAVRVSTDGSVLPHYNKRAANIRAWDTTIRETGTMGLVATSWARGTTFCPPNYIPDLIGPLLKELSGAGSPNFFEGIPSEKVTGIVETLGRCREDWRLEDEVAREMEALEPQITHHQYEWKSLRLMARLLALQRRCSFALQEVHDFHANLHPVEPEWQRRLDDQKKLIGELGRMREDVHSHFSLRYTGQAFEEWISTLFDKYTEDLMACRTICQQKLEAAALRYCDDIGSVRTGEQAILPAADDSPLVTIR